MEQKEICAGCPLHDACWEDNINPGNACPGSNNDSTTGGGDE